MSVFLYVQKYSDLSRMFKLLYCFFVLFFSTLLCVRIAFIDSVKHLPIKMVRCKFLTYFLLLLFLFSCWTDDLEKIKEGPALKEKKKSRKLDVSSTLTEKFSPKKNLTDECIYLLLLMKL